VINRLSRALDLPDPETCVREFRVACASIERALGVGSARN
jgi:hypothetical protein